MFVLSILLKGVAIYFIVLIVIRFMGKREMDNLVFLILQFFFMLVTSRWNGR